MPCPVAEVGRFATQQTGTVQRDVCEPPIDGTQGVAARAKRMDPPHGQTQHHREQASREVDGKEQQSVARVVQRLLDHHDARGGREDPHLRGRRAPDPGERARRRKQQDRGGRGERAGTGGERGDSAT